MEENLYKEENIPDMLPAKKQKRKLRPWQGILFFVLVILAMIFICSTMQYYWGMAGLAATELFLLCMSLLYVWILRADFKEVFPFRKLQLSPFFGTMLLWGAGYLLLMVLMVTLMYLFPEEYFSVSEGLSDFMQDTNPFVEFFVTAFMAAVCEEMVTRGVIQNSLYPLRNKWLIITLVGVMFGILHMDPIRFLPTAFLGGLMAYVVYETKNLLYGMLFHFLNNGFISVISLFQTGSVDESVDLLLEQPALILMSLGSYMMMACVAPFLLYTAAYLVRRGNSRGEKVTYLPARGKGVVLTILISTTVLLLIGGLVLMVAIILLHPEMLMDTVESMKYAV
ncbi:MAG: CPBP family intramembrane metalloprotease [Lachnospiraceae bacterium]|nr:CPBP family intramembrane metalloprotease [Lachnospiraceae bacterium]